MYGLTTESRQSIRGMSATYGIALLTATLTLECDCSNTGKVIVQIISLALLFLISPSNGQGIYIFASAIYFNKFTSPHTAMPFFRLSIYRICQAETSAVIIYPTSSTSTVGGAIVFTCVVYAVPVPNITWSVTNQYGSTSVVQNTSTTSIQTSTIISNTYTYAVSYLVICNTTENTTGNYACTGNNGVNGTNLTVTSAVFSVTVTGIWPIPVHATCI